MILADPSAWIEYDRATGSPLDERMATLIAGESDLAVTEPVLMEVLAGAKTEERASELRRLLARFPLLRLDPASDFEAAARIYRRGRRNGVTPRGMVDCLIVAVAWRHDAALLTSDKGLARLATMLDLILDESSVHPP